MVRIRGNARVGRRICVSAVVLRRAHVCLGILCLSGPLQGHPCVCNPSAFVCLLLRPRGGVARALCGAASLPRASATGGGGGGPPTVFGDREAPGGALHGRRSIPAPPALLHAAEVWRRVLLGAFAAPREVQPGIDTRVLVWGFTCRTSRWSGTHLLSARATHASAGVLRQTGWYLLRSQVACDLMRFTHTGLQTL